MSQGQQTACLNTTTNIPYMLSLFSCGAAPLRGAAIAAQMWPYVDSAVSDVGLQRLDRALKERRARWMLDVAVEQWVFRLLCSNS